MALIKSTWILGDLHVGILKIQNIQMQELSWDAEVENNIFDKPSFSGWFLVTQYYYGKPLQFFVKVFINELRLLVGVIFFIFGIFASKYIWFFNRSGKINHEK